VSNSRTTDHPIAAELTAAAAQLQRRISKQVTALACHLAEARQKYRTAVLAQTGDLSDEQLTKLKRQLHCKLNIFFRNDRSEFRLGWVRRSHRARNGGKPVNTWWRGNSYPTHRLTEIAQPWEKDLIIAIEYEFRNIRQEWEKVKELRRMARWIRNKIHDGVNDSALPSEILAAQVEVPQNAKTLVALAVEADAVTLISQNGVADPT